MKCLFRYLHTSDHNPRTIRMVDKYFTRELDFKDIKLPVKIRDIHKVEKKNCICISVFNHENKEKYLIYVSRNTFKRHVDLLLVGEEGKRHYVLIKDFNSFMYDHKLNHGRKHFCCYCLQAFSTKQIVKCYIDDCFKINGKQKIKMPKNKKKFKKIIIKNISIIMIEK